MQKTLIASAVIAVMMNSVSAAPIDGSTIKDGYAFDNASQALDITGSVSANGITINAKDLTVTNDNKTGAVNPFTTMGKTTITTVGDMTINHQTGNGIFMSNSATGPTSFTADIGGDLVINSEAGWAIHAEGSGPEQGNVTIKAKNVIISSKSEGITNNGNGKINITAENISINTANAFAISSRHDEINLTATTGDIVIKHEGKKSEDWKGRPTGALVNQNGTINIAAPKGNTVVVGDMVNWADGTGTINATFNGAGSSFTGAVKQQTADTASRTNLGFTAGSKWTATDDSQVNSIKIQDATIDTNGANVTVAKIDGKGTVAIDAGAQKLGSFKVTDAASKADLTVDMVQTADTVTADIAKKVMGQVTTAGDSVTLVGEAREGLVSGTTTFDKTGAVTSVATNSLMKDTLELASAGTLSLNRILMNDVRKRMGDLRAGEGESGVWARYDGGKLSGSGDLENQFNTIQVGIDTVPTPGSVRFGVAASYTQGDVDYTRGSSDMDAWGLSAYGIWMADNGMFADVVARMAKADNDMTVDGSMKGSTDNVALSLSGEFGWRFDITDMIYAEPQLELSYTHLDAEGLTLEGAGKKASYTFDEVDSLLGRAGFAAGLKCPDNMDDVYVRVSAVHEFMGDAKITGMAAGKTQAYELDGKDTWVEYGIGANINFTKNAYMWADLERTSGAVLDEDWRATVGVRYSF